MLREISQINKQPDGPHRRWFVCDIFDLIIWYGSNGNVKGFQLCYRQGEDEKAFTWLKDSGYSHNRVDDGEGRIMSFKMSPILLSDGIFDKAAILGLFKKESRGMDESIANLVQEKIAEFSGN